MVCYYLHVFWKGLGFLGSLQLLPQPLLSERWLATSPRLLSGRGSLLLFGRLPLGRSGLLLLAFLLEGFRVLELFETIATAIALERWFAIISAPPVGEG